MALSCSSNGLLVTTVIALLFLPIQYYIPDVVHDLRFSKEDPPPLKEEEGSAFLWIDNAVAQFPPLDILATISVLIIGLTFYIFDWIHRKILECRLAKLNQGLTTSMERLRIWDKQREELDNILKMVQNATSEYNLVLCLLLRQRHYLGEDLGPPSETIFEKFMQDDNLSKFRDSYS
ncbi:hypothetical protein K1T71_001509 [Dendrolimus kikuchii]|uniref:Uncharacterized protein n=1 Tax=Dendrolimus kikuchii TaxID=765133 RepID=A0ACC1DHW3_9NEOP|nr:hypothetical protein K1T71_001509 [Dendrolimus kikuchii]